jgi:3-hydroxybutyrate dehydrogenase
VPGYGRTPLVDSQIPERPKELGISVGGECTTGEDVSDSVLHFAGFPTNALAGQALIVSRGGFME